MPLIKPTEIEDGQCPRCKGLNVFWNASNPAPDNTAYFLMYCEDCEKHYNAVYEFKHTIHDPEDDY